MKHVRNLMGVKIDVHSHIIPKGYLHKLLKLRAIPKIEQDEDGRYILWYCKGLKYSFDERMYSIVRKLRAMKESGIDMQVLSLAMPGVDFLEPRLGWDLARIVNDEIAKVVEKYPDKFLGMATVPLQDTKKAIDELDRTINMLGLRGVEIFSNVAGKPLDDEELWPFYERVTKLDVPILIHPTKPVMAETMMEYGLANVVGFLFDTTLAILRIVFGGILEKYPALKIILPHMGSTIPYLIGRIDHQCRINPKCGAKISKMPSQYLKLIYIDTAQSFYNPAMRCAFAFSGSDRILFGSDYPFANLDRSIRSIEEMELPKEDNDKIFSGNAIKILKY